MPLLHHIGDMIFTMASLPECKLPAAATWIPGVKTAVAEFAKLIYLRGLFDGFLLGAIIVLALRKYRDKP